MNEKPGYYQRVNTDLLDRIPLTAETVLEVGCGAGALGAAFKTRQPNVTFWGVEYEEAHANYARKFLDYVICGDVEDLSLILPPLGSVNCIIYGDVLEHLRDPWSLLRRHVKLLADDGVVLACIPNVQHWSVLIELLKGNWPLLEEGIFDKTHLRWFTHDSIVEMMTQCGLHLDEIYPRILQVEKVEAFVKALQPALSELGVNSRSLFQGVAPIQYVVRASLKKRMPLHLDILLTLKSIPAMAEVRLVKPTRSLETLPRISAQIGHRLKFIEVKEDSPRLLIWQRLNPFMRSSKEFRLLQVLVRLGYVVVAEFDDSPDIVTKNQEESCIPFRGVHAVQTSTQCLADEIEHYNPEVKAFSNNLDVLPGKKPSWRRGDRLKIFFGALNREEDWAPWIDVLNQVFAS